MALLLIAVLSAASIQRASAAETIPAYQAQVPVSINGVVSPGEWSDAQITNITGAVMGVAFKHNATGLLILMQWQQSPSVCYDQYCYGAMEFDSLNNTGEMGSNLYPAVMLLLSTSFKGGYDEFLSRAETTPTSVESSGYSTQSTCALKLSGTMYTAECYRPFELTNASSSDPFANFASGSSIEVGFAVGEFSEPGLHAATDMVTYVLSLSSQTYTASTTTSSGATTSSTQGSASATQASSATTSASQTTTTTSASQTTTSVAASTSSSTTATTTSSSSLLSFSYLAMVGAVGLVAAGLLLKAPRRRTSIIR
ncbi:MAG: hypothetical protein ABSF83_15605 [Nitrososphaerales archaeon]|jgi:hypothetical protein